MVMPASVITLWAFSGGIPSRSKINFQGCFHKVKPLVYSVLMLLSGMIISSENTISQRFLEPVFSALNKAKFTRRCVKYSDSDFLQAGIGRVMAPVQSGREWVQQLQMTINAAINVSLFFDGLKSKRRLRLLEEINASLLNDLKSVAGTRKDPLRNIPSLDAYAVYASDGHYEEAASHTKPLFDKIRPPAGFFAINLRTRGLSLLDIARPKPLKVKEHDITALKRLGSTLLRMGEPKGVKVIHVYDPAIVDYRAWAMWKARGVYTITCEKNNSAAEIQGELEWDATLSENAGVVSDHLVAPGAGYLLRRVVYVDPVLGTTYRFLTNVIEVPPGAIAFLYKLRWDIEKAFDEKKNKLNEKKSWATSTTALSQQAQFIAITYNLMNLLENTLEDEEGVKDEKVLERKRKRTEYEEELAQKRNATPNTHVSQHQRPSQRSLQFIRWLRHCLTFETPWSEGVDLLRPYMAKYIS